MPEVSPDTISRPAWKLTHSRALLDRLRTETQEEHQRLEDCLDLLRPGLTVAAYAEILGRFYGFYRPWESQIAFAASRLLPDFAQRQKVPALIADLNCLGVDFAALPFCSRLPACDNAFAVLGGLYVTEGATLGGQIISRHLRRTFPFPADRGDCFFRSYGNKVGEMWSSFRTVLSAHASPSSDDGIIQAARNTFQAFYEWLSEAK